MSVTEALSCKELVELVTDYLEGTLPAIEGARFERHIAGCEHCTRYLDQMRITIRTMGQITEENIAPAARDELLAAFRGWRAG